MIPRPIYMEKLIASQDPEVVKVLTGVRRCGKSKLLVLFKKYLVDQGVPEANIVEINYEYSSSVDLQDPKAFYAHVKENMPEEGPAYLFIDEVQELTKWAKAINGVRAEFDIDIYVTGSNSRMFSGEHLTYLSGRYIEIKVYPLSFPEYLVFKNINPKTTGFGIEGVYDSYSTLGSFPAVALANSEGMAETLLDGLYDSVFSRDIQLRGKVRNETAFLRIATFALDNIGNQTSANAIATTLRSEGHAANSDTVDNYLTLMCNAFLLYRCNRYDIRGKEHLRTNGKYYVVDLGLRNRILGYRDSNNGHLSENMVYLELLRRGYDVSIGTLPQAEIDFVAQKRDDCRYVQVSETVLDAGVKDREFAPFEKLNDGYPRILITKDWSDYSENGIRHINFYEFLLGAHL